MWWPLGIRYGSSWETPASSTLTSDSPDFNGDGSANVPQGMKNVRHFPKIRGTLLGVPIIRTIVFWGLYWGPLILGNYHIVLSNNQGYLFRALYNRNILGSILGSPM